LSSYYTGREDIFSSDTFDIIGGMIALVG
jgi:hypothetical protein